jgi:hypothetical protein
MSDGGLLTIGFFLWQAYVACSSEANLLVFVAMMKWKRHFAGVTFLILAVSAVPIIVSAEENRLRLYRPRTYLKRMRKPRL